jgi:hypothetical protein
MSQVKMDMIWQHQKVLPYILNGLRQKIDAITPMQRMYLIGSRGRTPISQWDTLEGKDWDVLVICRFPIVNTTVWTQALNYHIDLLVTTPQKENNYLKNAGTYVELYPENRLPMPLESI